MKSKMLFAVKCDLVLQKICEASIDDHIKRKLDLNMSMINWYYLKEVVERYENDRPDENERCAV